MSPSGEISAVAIWSRISLILSSLNPWPCLFVKKDPFSDSWSWRKERPPRLSLRIFYKCCLADSNTLSSRLKESSKLDSSWVFNFPAENWLVSKARSWLRSRVFEAKKTVSVRMSAWFSPMTRYSSLSLITPWLTQKPSSFFAVSIDIINV